MTKIAGTAICIGLSVLIVSAAAGCGSEVASRETTKKVSQAVDFFTTIACPGEDSFEGGTGTGTASFSDRHFGRLSDGISCPDECSRALEWADANAVAECQKSVGPHSCECPAGDTGCTQTRSGCTVADDEHSCRVSPTSIECSGTDPSDTCYWSCPATAEATARGTVTIKCSEDGHACDAQVPEY
jgi:hypothetical protein